MHYVRTGQLVLLSMCPSGLVDLHRLSNLLPQVELRGVRLDSRLLLSRPEAGMVEQDTHAHNYWGSLEFNL